MKQTIVKTTDENDDVKKRKKSSRRNKMLVIFRELCFLLIVTFSAYATILNSQPKTRKGAPSSPFFKNSNVDDFYQGELSQLMHEVGSATYSFVLFYAPWDADSQDLKYEFLETAEFYSSQVYFAGVNCWEPGSECRTRFKHVVDRYPQLVAYVGLERAVEYKGPHKADYMIKFLSSIIHPIIRLESVTDLWKVRYIHDAVLVGFLKINGPSETGLNALYETALTLASRDYLHRTAVAAFTNSRFNSIVGINEAPSVYLYIWDRRLHYNGTLKRGPLLKWVMESLKGNLISTDGLLLLKPPTVVMFTPLHPFALVNPSYHMLRRVAMSTSNISRGEQDFFSFVIKHNSAFQEAYYQEIIKKDAETRDLCSKYMLGSRTCTIRPKWDNSTCRIYYRNDFYHGDEREMVKSQWREEQCKILDRSPLPPTSIPPSLTEVNLNVTFGFACLDSKLFSHLAEAIGINISSEPEDTVIVIIGEEEIIKVPVANEESLLMALQNWARGKMGRTVLTWEQPKPVQVIEKERVYLQELNLQSFNHLVDQKDQHGLILYHSRYCGACARASHFLLEVAHLLKGVKCIRIARVDGDKVSLPWHYSLHFFPSLLFLPAVKKSESRLFPADMAWSFNSLSRFIIANLNLEERPEVMLALCGRWGQNPENSLEGSECIREARKVSLEGIELKLKEARRQRERKSLPIHLDFLKAVHLSLARVTDISQSLDLIRSLSRSYHVGCSVT